VRNPRNLKDHHSYGCSGGTVNPTLSSLLLHKGIGDTQVPFPYYFKHMKKQYRQFGRSLCQTGKNIIQQTFNLKPQVKQFGEIHSIIKSKTGIRNISLADYSYNTLNWDKWLELIEADWTNEVRYKKQFRDCDNLAFIFAGRISELFEINTAGVVYGAVYENGKEKYRHYWNCIVTSDNKLYYYDPMIDKHTEVKSDMTQLGKYDYLPVSFRLF